jgi:flagellar biosynthesis/type III secretory pathway M-ring protein FliF/YscJ
MCLAVINFSEVWPIIATVVGIAGGIVSAAIWFSMQSLKDLINSTAKRQTEDKQAIDKEVASIKDRMAICRRECDDGHASKEEYLREAGYTRRFQERQIADMAEIKALVNKMPEMTAQIVRSIIAEMKRGEQ